MNSYWMDQLDRLERWSFGDSAAMADELGALVVEGRKTATASLLKIYELENEPLPIAGKLSIIENSENQPLCIVETVEITIKPFNQIDATFAADEGEGDRSLAYWRTVHHQFFSRECQQFNLVFSEDMEVICERFYVVHRF